MTLTLASTDCRSLTPGTLSGETAVVCEDTRKEYAEQRFEATGYIGDRLHVMVYCLRSDSVRVISLRKANAREVKRYAQT